ncbi:hypothetical protein BG006_003883, partial [Podila minutissima]
IALRLHKSLWRLYHRAVKEQPQQLSRQRTAPMALEMEATTRGSQMQSRYLHRTPVWSISPLATISHLQSA